MDDDIDLRLAGTGDFPEPLRIADVEVGIFRNPPAEVLLRLSELCLWETRNVGGRGANLAFSLLNTDLFVPQLRNEIPGPDTRRTTRNNCRFWYSGNMAVLRWNPCVLSDAIAFEIGDFGTRRRAPAA